MKQLIIPLLLTLLSPLLANAQNGMAIEQFFDDGLPHAQGADVTAVSITGNKLKDYNLDIYRSVSVTGDPELIRKIERAVTRDGTRAESREVSLKEGHLYFGFYTIPLKAGDSGYMFYLNTTLTGGNKATLIYMQGEASPEEIKSLIKR